MIIVLYLVVTHKHAHTHTHAQLANILILGDVGEYTSGGAIGALVISIYYGVQLIVISR